MSSSASIVLDEELVEEIAARLDLREPNREALQTIALELSQHYDVAGQTQPFEGVVDVATGVGKTYIMAAAIDYLVAARDIRNFAIITPGRTILTKTQDNFTPGAPKSLIEFMATRPVVITSENFNTPAMRAAMDDPEQVKLYIFTVQALTKPNTETGRKTHKFQEGLGEAFYQHLLDLDDLVLFADEHHTYYGEAFSKAIRDLSPFALIGLTATPHKKTPEEQIIYRYPLAAAIAAQLVKTPVIVGRQDDRNDTATKLLDGTRLLDYKREAIARYCAQTGNTPVNPVMLVIARSIEDAEECRQIIQDPSFAGGTYADKVLVIHSDAPDAALADLEQVEEPESPIRIIISVGMLKEGWDVKNVYVIVSLRASISDILTEQTLGRGLRLPFGAYTGVEILDALEVLAHERYEELLRRSNALNERFIDFRTRSVVRTNALGQQVAARENTQVSTTLSPFTTSAASTGIEPVPEQTATATMPSGAPAGEVNGLTGPRMASTPERMAQAEAALTLSHELVPRRDIPALRIPQLVMTNIRGTFSLADITDLTPFRRLGERIAADPAGQLRRTAVSARIVTGADGGRRTEVVTTTGADTIISQAPLIPRDEAVERLRERVLAAPVVPARKSERAAAEPLLDAFLAGLGDNAQTILSAYGERAADELIQLVTAEHRKFAAKPQIEEVIRIETFAPVRLSKPTTSSNRYAPFSKTTGYEGWAKCMYTQAWFDSEPERAVANMLDAASEIAYWVRLSIGDLPILWSEAGNWYHPDFIAIEEDGTHWIVEVKSDKELESADVRAKSEAAKRWANHVSVDPAVGTRWRYLLVSQSEVEAARGSWPALRQRGI